jgi:hypothetical protein
MASHKATKKAPVKRIQIRRLDKVETTGVTSNSG